MTWVARDGSCKALEEPVVVQARTVGMAGSTLGGGLGWLSGMHGAVCDNLLSAELMTSDGRTVAASATENPDLFWGLRGAGANFGVTTSFEYQLHPLPEFTAGGFTYQMRDARAVLRFFRDFMAAAPDELQAYPWFGWLPDGDRCVEVVVCYAGDGKHARAVFEPLRAVAVPVIDTVRPRSYAETLAIGVNSPDAPPSGYSAVKGTYLEHLSDEAIDIVLDHMARAPASGLVGLDHYMHGAVCRVAPDATAFSLRAAGALFLWIGTGWDEPSFEASSTGWMDDTWRALQSYSGGRIYTNYQSTEGVAANQEAFGAGYARVRALKKKYDPTKFFQRNQNIRPGADS